jgi:hypothetical protein
MNTVIKEDRNTPKVADEGGDGGQGYGHPVRQRNLDKIQLLYEQRIERRCASR